MEIKWTILNCNKYILNEYSTMYSISIKYSNEYVINDVLNGNKFSIKYVLKQVLNL